MKNGRISGHLEPDFWYIPKSGSQLSGLLLTYVTLSCVETRLGDRMGIQAVKDLVQAVPRGSAETLSNLGCG